MTDEELEAEEAMALATIEAKLSSTNQDVEAARILTPVESVEKSLAKFAKDSFEIVRNDYVFHEKIQDEIVRRLDRFTENQLVALLSNDSVNLNDRVSKVMAPTMGLITTKQQAEIAAKTQMAKDGTLGNSTAKELSQSVTTDVLNGMKALTDVLDIVTRTARQVKPEPEPIDVTVEKAEEEDT